MKDGKLYYVYNWVGILKQQVVSNKSVPTGASTLSAIFTKEGENPPHVANDTLALYINDEQVGEMKMKTQPGKFAIAGEGLNVGRAGHGGLSRRSALGVHRHDQSGGGGCQ